MCKDAKAGVARDAEWPLSIVLHIRLPVPRRGFQKAFSFSACNTKIGHVPRRRVAKSRSRTEPAATDSYAQRLGRVAKF